MRARQRALPLDFIGERLELSRNVVLDRRLLDAPEELEPGRNVPEVVQSCARWDRCQGIAACEGSQAARDGPRLQPVRGILVNLESHLHRHRQQPDDGEVGLLDSDFGAASSDDMAAMQIRNEMMSSSSIRTARYSFRRRCSRKWSTPRLSRSGRRAGSCFRSSPACC